MSTASVQTAQLARTLISDLTLVRPPAARETGTGTGTVCLPEGRGVVVIAMDTVEMMAGAAANERGIRGGPRGGDPVLLLAVERFPGFLFRPWTHRACSLMRSPTDLCSRFLIL